MRLAGIAKLRDLAWAIIEPRGRMSFIQRSGPEPPKRMNDEDPGVV